MGYHWIPASKQQERGAQFVNIHQLSLESGEEQKKILHLTDVMLWEKKSPHPHEQGGSPALQGNLVASEDNSVIKNHSGDHQAHIQVNFFLTVIFLECQKTNMCVST